MWNDSSHSPWSCHVFHNPTRERTIIDRQTVPMTLRVTQITDETTMPNSKIRIRGDCSVSHFLRASVPISKFVGNRNTATKHKRLCISLVLVRLLPRRAENLVMSMCHELTTQDTSEDSPGARFFSELL